MTQEDLAERCGLFRTYMSRIETGKANPTLNMIHALATSLGVSVVELFVAAPPVRKAALPTPRPTSHPTPRPTPRPSRGRVTR